MTSQPATDPFPPGEPSSRDGRLGRSAGGPLVDALSLAARLERTVVLDATVELAAPRFDGDHVSASGLSGWEREHIPGSRHADLLESLSDPAAGYHFAHPSPEALASALVSWGVADGVPVVVYDRAGGLWAARLWWLLDWIGVPASVLDGGFAAWRATGLPVESGPSAPLPPAAPTASVAASEAFNPSAAASGALAPRVREGRWVTLDDLSGVLEGGVAAHVSCALGADAYRGDVPTRYSRRGHIPGTSNVPARSLIGADGRFLPPAELRAALGELLTTPDPVWLYCGGGISASVVALALRVSGRDDVALYDGSLEEWSATTLPLETGPASERAAASARLPALARELLDRPEFAVLTTLGTDGCPQSSVMWAGRDGDEIVMATKASRQKVRNIRRDARVTVLLYDRTRPTRYVEVRGTAEVGDPGDEGRALINVLARRYTGADHQVVDPAPEAERVVLRIRAGRVIVQE